MKVLFLGTGAAGCISTPESDIAEGKRRCASMLIDQTVLVDVALQSFDYATKLGVDTAAVTDIFLSHAHGDHFSKKALFSYASVARTKINFWCHRDAVENLKLTEEEAALINLCPVEVGQTWEAAGMTVTAFSANHIVGGREQPLHYVFEKDGRLLFYGCDGGWFTAPTWEAMRKMTFNGLILDATVGEDEGNFRIGTHNTIPMLRLIVAALGQNQMLRENAVLIANHIAPKVHGMSHEETAAVLSEFGMLTAYDGFSVEI